MAVSFKTVSFVWLFSVTSTYNCATRHGNTNVKEFKAKGNDKSSDERDRFFLAMYHKNGPISMPSYPEYPLSPDLASVTYQSGQETLFSVGCLSEPETVRIPSAPANSQFGYEDESLKSSVVFNDGPGRNRKYLYEFSPYPKLDFKNIPQNKGLCGIIHGTTELDKLKEIKKPARTRNDRLGFGASAAFLIQTCTGLAMTEASLITTAMPLLSTSFAGSLLSSLVIAEFTPQVVLGLVGSHVFCAGNAVMFKITWENTFFQKNSNAFGQFLSNVESKTMDDLKADSLKLRLWDALSALETKVKSDLKLSLEERMFRHVEISAAKRGVINPLLVTNFNQKLEAEFESAQFSFFKHSFLESLKNTVDKAESDHEMSMLALFQKKIGK